MLIGACLLLGMMAFLASALGSLPSWPAGGLVWTGAVLGFARADAPTRKLSLALLAAGAAALAVALGRGASFDPAADLARMATINLPIVGLFLGVAFLSLVAAPVADTDVAQPRTGGLWSTLLAVHLVGAVINLSMTAMSGDRMMRGGSLGRREAIVLARGHCAAAFWSPFFVAAAVAHTYAPEARAMVTVPLGIVGAIAALLLTARDVQRSRTDTEATTAFVGIVPDRRALLLTGALLAAAIGLKLLLPEVPMVVVVTAVTPPLALLLMPASARAGAAQRLLGTTLPATIGQVVLFLAAGVFAFGISTLLSGASGAFDALQGHMGIWVYLLSIALIVAAGYIGVHPVITIAALASVLVPAGADQSLLAFSFLSGWAVGTAVAPLSGMNLFLIGRYRVRAREILRWGPGYALRMLAVLGVLMVVAEQVVQA